MCLFGSLTASPATDTIEHVFDVGDTHHLDNVPFELWQVKKGYETEIAEALENRFGDVGSKADFANAVATACANLVQENIQDYVRELYDSAEGSFLDDLDDDNLRYRLMLTTQASVTYVVLTRLGLEEETEIHAPAEAFECIHEFNTPATINILGTATGDMTEICLREIERTAKFLDNSYVNGQQPAVCLKATIFVILSKDFNPLLSRPLNTMRFCLNFVVLVSI